MPRGNLRKVSFTLTYVPNGIEYQQTLLINGRIFNIGSHDFQTRRLLSIVRRSCNDSDKPGERCELLQVTINGTNEHISELNNSRLEFWVLGANRLPPPVATVEPITLRIVGRYLKVIIHS